MKGLDSAVLVPRLNYLKDFIEIIQRSGVSVHTVKNVQNIDLEKKVYIITNINVFFAITIHLRSAITKSIY